MMPAIAWMGLALWFAQAGEWPQFRGPNGSGVSPAPLKLPRRVNVPFAHSSPASPSPVTDGKAVCGFFGDKDGGISTTVNAKTGEIQKQRWLTGALDTYYASPVAARQLLNVNDFGEDSFSTPAIAGGHIYVRTRTKLYAF